MSIQLGDKVRDMVTGLEGIATARVEFLNKCVRFAIQIPVKDGKIEDGTYFDEEQLEVIQVQAVKTSKMSQTGGDRPSPRRSPDPTR